MEPPPELGSERSVVQLAFEKAIEDHPGAAADEAIYRPPTPPPSNIAPASVEQPAALNGYDRIAQRPRVFALPRSPSRRYRQSPRVRSSWSN
jgi:hypothetical protein